MLTARTLKDKRWEKRKKIPKKKKKIFNIYLHYKPQGAHGNKSPPIPT